MPQAIRVVDRIADQADFQGPAADGQLMRYDSGVAKWLSVTLQRETPAGTVNGSNATFTLTAAPGLVSSLTVWVNGIVQRAGASNDYTVAGAVVTFTAGSIPQTGDVVEVSYLS